MSKRRKRISVPPVHFPGPNVFGDTSFLYAVLDSGDDHHARAIQISEYLKESRVQVYVTWDVIGETVTLLRYRSSHRDARTFIDEVLPELSIVPVTDADRYMALALFKKLGRDKTLSYCDVLSYWMIVEHLEHVPAVAFDEDFKSLGLTVVC